MHIRDLPTPSLLLDEQKLDRNIGRMRGRIAELGVEFRPHMKTHKCTAVARKMTEGQAGGITVSTLREARYFLKAGYRDILYAVGITPDKLPEVAALGRDGAHMTVVLDNPAVAGATARAATELGASIDILIEIDTDGHRAGLAPGDPALVETARRLTESEAVRLKGVMTHAGESYACRSLAEIRDMAETERAGAVVAATRLRTAGFPCPIVSVGSTPTAMLAADLSGVTEVRAGVYCFQDLVMAGLGICSIDDIAVSVLASVISHQPARNWIILDAGGLALSKDNGTGGHAIDRGYGLVCNAGGTTMQGLHVRRANQEHGIAVPDCGMAPFARLPLGARARILPVHVCMTAAAHDCYHIVGRNGEVTGRWERDNGW